MRSSVAAKWATRYPRMTLGEDLMRPVHELLALAIPFLLCSCGGAAKGGGAPGPDASPAGAEAGVDAQVDADASAQPEASDAQSDSGSVDVSTAEDGPSA